MELGIKGKVALITGVGSQIGMGKAIALTLAGEGCDIIATDIDLAGAEKTAAEVKALERKVVVYKADVTNRDEVNKMVEAGLKEFGRIDILVNNAGGTTFTGPLATAEMEGIEKEIDLNLWGVIYCTKAVLPSMIERKSGRIVIISSSAGRSSVPGGSGYSAAKAGVMSLARTVAKEAGPSGITVNAIAPGLALTNFYGGEGFPMLPPQMRESTENPMVPTGKITTVQDIANAVLFLVSDLSSNITGQSISVDGGMLMP